MIVSLLAVLKAGGAYVPLETEQPTERLRVILQQTQMPLLLTVSQEHWASSANPRDTSGFAEATQTKSRRPAATKLPLLGLS